MTNNKYMPKGEALKNIKKTLGKHNIPARLFNHYISLKGIVEDQIDCRMYIMRYERRFLRICRMYIQVIKKNGLERKIHNLHEEIYKAIKGTHISHYVRLAEEFPDILPVKTTTSSLLEAELASKS